MNPYIQKQFCHYAIAEEMRQLGFDEPCWGWYIDIENGPIYMQIRPLEGEHPKRNSEMPVNAPVAPLLQQAVDYLREVHEVDVIYVKRYLSLSVPGDFKFIFNVWPLGIEVEGNTYHEAYNTAISKALEIVKQRPI